MCGDLKRRLSPFDLEMEAAGFQDKGGVVHKSCSKLLELAATDDVEGFKFEVEERCSDIDGVSFWYGRSFGSKKRMGFEERTPIMIASLYGSLEVLKYILETGKVDVNRACGSDGATALHCAAAGGSWSSVEAVGLLIDASADVNAIDVNGKKPGDLIAPCVKSCGSSKRRGVLEMLLNGIKVETGDLEGEGEEGGGSRTPRAEKKEYPVDVSLPDINNGVYGSDEFRMYSFKVKPCSRAYSHDWTECPFVHPGENARRRDPRKYHYTCVPCPEFKKGSCAKGDACEYAHGVFESWLHPAQYRTRLCKDETGCSRKVCFFAHRTEELRPLYASTGSAMPSPKSVVANSMDMTALSPLSLGSPSLMLPNTSTPPMSPSVVASSSSPMGGWQNKVNLTPPALQLPGSRLKAALSARDMDLDMELRGLDKIHTQQQRQQQLEELASLSSPYGRMGDLKPTNLDDVFGSLDPALLSQLQGLSPKISGSGSSAQLQSPTGLQMRQNMNQLRASYPSTVSSSPSRKSPAAYGFDTSAAVAAAVMNSRSAAFSKRSQSFIDRSGGGGAAASYRSNLSGSASSASLMPPKLSEWGSPNGKLEWGFNGEEANKLRKSASFGFRSGGNNVITPTSPSVAVAASIGDEPDVSWVNSLVKDVPLQQQRQGGGVHDTMPHWFDQMYIEQEQILA
ncbi:zinc finger CCCH domain-containing protein 29 [Andrographis paniculata]|uniref:zinc finger CCCH domain-containing protein 29 n=1 Tax=Andrographis paniculata TaxID=175694 RepID=UPI0021E75A21|nr:zinc finger CCCH domain-containing protein 29 [Andrographis paniculata]